MRGPAAVTKRCTLSFNPIDIRHWIRRRYMADFADNAKLIREPGRVVLRTTYLDNRFLTPDDVARIEAYKIDNPYYYSVYGLGMWGVLGDSIFSNWHTEDLSQFDGELKWGIDFGYSNDPAALVGVCRKNGKLYIPVALFGKGWTNQYLAERVAPIVGKGIVRCDNAEPKSIAELRAAGISAYPCRKHRYFAKYNPSRQSSLLYRIQWTQGHEIIVDARLNDMIRELGAYQWRKDKDGASIAEPVDRDDHGISALWYALDADMEPAMHGTIMSANSLLVQTEAESKEADGILLKEAV